MSCETCVVDSLFGKDISAKFYALTQQKDNGGLSYPSVDVLKILRIVECVFKQYLGDVPSKI